ncbi:unnamed protein product [Symbiodinium necroappetens]|uniref:Uncharacterized protein n=1 Tax=Symbiodinium necroappetens TaxID=1628268 RepID=A0A813C728_9DINO|nr:unnamed protein product [Symbiodinium necroappetens]
MAEIGADPVQCRRGMVTFAITVKAAHSCGPLVFSSHDVRYCCVAARVLSWLVCEPGSTAAGYRKSMADLDEFDEAERAFENQPEPRSMSVQTAAPNSEQEF